MKNKYFFLHVPKTAGSSMITVFNNTLGHENVVGVADIDNFDSQQASMLANSMLINGHFTVTHQKEYFNDRYSIVFLRNPIDRFISYYFFTKKHGYDENAVNLDLFSYLDFCQNQEWYYNINTHTFFLTGVMHKIPEKDLLDMAKENLSKMNFVGICEFFLDSIDLLFYECKWPPLQEIPFVNVNDNRPKLHELDCKILDRIEELNKIDMELYQYGVNLFNEKKRNILRECVKKNYEMR